MAKVSVIIPSYNSEQYLEKCLDSLLNQSLKDIEIIFINDGSTDSTKEILDNYKDPRLKIFNNKNHGIGYSRNYGLLKSTSDYITFIDSDDYVDKYFCEKMYKKAIKDNLDLVICDYYQVEGNDIVNYEFPRLEITSYKDNPSILLNINLSPWNKLYKKSLLTGNKILFSENLKYEDALFVAQIIHNAKRVSTIPEKLNYYIIHSNSQTTNMNKRVFDILEILKRICDEYKNEDKEYLEKLICREISIYIIRQRYQKDKELRNKFIDEAFSFLNKNVDNYRNNKYYKERSFFKSIIEKNKWLTKLYCNLYNIVK